VPGTGRTGRNVAGDNTPPRLLRRRRYAHYGDVHDPATLSTALADGETPCYLVHFLSGADFQRGPA
jgi:hypothetical protein